MGKGRGEQKKMLEKKIELRKLFKLAMFFESQLSENFLFQYRSALNGDHSGEKIQLFSQFQMKSIFGEEARGRFSGLFFLSLSFRALVSLLGRFF